MVTKKASDQSKDGSITSKKSSKGATRKAERTAPAAKSPKLEDQEAQSVLSSRSGKTSDSKGEKTMSSDYSTLANGVKAVSEAYVVPGSSLIMDGDIKGGSLHLVGGLAAKAVLGPLGWGLFAADSFSVSVSGKHLHQHFFEKKQVEEQAAS